MTDDAWAALRQQRDHLAAAKQAKRIDRMHALHGVAQGRVCGDCAHCRRTNRDMARQVWKCSAYGDSRSAATDWRLRWVACGLFEARP